MVEENQFGDVVPYVITHATRNRQLCLRVAVGLILSMHFTKMSLLPNKINKHYDIMKANTYWLLYNLLRVQQKETNKISFTYSIS